MDNRRQQHSIDETVLSKSFIADIEQTNALARALDDALDVEARTQVSLPGPSHEQPVVPDTVLRRILSLESIKSIETVSSFATIQEASRVQAGICLRKIGFGQCGLILERPGRPYVLKLCRPGFSDGLWNDCVAHSRIRSAFSAHKLEVLVPNMYAFVAKEDTNWWDEHLPLFPGQHPDFPIPSRALITERVLPLPKVVRQALISKFCPAPHQANALTSDANRDCLARVYLGRESPTHQSANFTLRNFNFHVDQMRTIGLPVKFFASAIAEALAVIHWVANVTAYDLEFVLGSEPRLNRKDEGADQFGLPLNANHSSLVAALAQFDIGTSIVFSQRTTRLWVIDFNLCGMWEEKTGWEHPETLINCLVEAFFENDPYYPLPHAESKENQELWAIFQHAYTRKAESVLASRDPRLQSLPKKFMDACEEREKKMLDAGRGHGARDQKQ